MHSKIGATFLFFLSIEARILLFGSIFSILIPDIKKHIKNKRIQDLNDPDVRLLYQLLLDYKQNYTLIDKLLNPILVDAD